MKETVPDGKLDGYTLVTVEDEIMLLSHDSDQCLQENVNKMDTEAGDCIDQNKSLTMRQTL